MNAPENAARTGQIALDALKRAGADKAQVHVSLSEKKEINIEIGEISLMRTMLNTQVMLKAIKGKKQATLSLNKIDEDSLRSAAHEVMQLVSASQDDDAYDIAPAQTKKSFRHGPLEADLEGMHMRLSEYGAKVKERFPELILEGCHFHHIKTVESLQNSNGVHFDQEAAHYTFVTMFVGKRGGKSSSFNYVYGMPNSMAHSLLDKKEWGLERIHQESVEQIDQTAFSGNFVGDVIVHPNCLDGFASQLIALAGDRGLINGTSLFKDKLNEQVISEKISLRSRARDESMSVVEFFNGDGIESQNYSIFEQGVLRNFALSQYGSKKTGLPKAPASVTNLVLDPGNTDLEAMIRATKRGLLLNRFSGGTPSQNGDFSGVAKNSFLIEDGRIVGPVNEVMVSGNLIELFTNVRDLSREIVDSGVSRYPWLAASGLRIAGK